MTEILEQGNKSRKKLLKGIEQLAEAVRVTLGPKGRNVLIRNTFGSIVITKDGVTVAKEIMLKDPVENMGAELVKEVAIIANAKAGDGTTTATILAHAIYSRGLESIEKGANPIEVKKGMDRALKRLTSNLKEKAKDITADDLLLREIGYIASNGDAVIADTLASIYKKLGKHAVITVDKSDGMETKVTTVKGMQFERGYISPYSITDTKKRIIRFENPMIFLYDGRLGQSKDVMAGMQLANEQARPIVFIADDVKEDALRTIIGNYRQGNVQSAIVKAPGFSSRRRFLLEELAILTGGKLFDPNTPIVEADTPSNYGSCKFIEISADTTLIADGAGAPEAIEKHIKDLKFKLKETDLDDYMRGKYEESLGKLTGGVSVIKVGAPSEAEAKELQYRVDDAKFAMKAALEEGIVQGGGIELVQAYIQWKGWTNALKKNQSEDFAKGIDIIKDSIMTPFNAIVANSGKDPKEIFNSFNSPKDGYDAREEKVVDDMFKAGIIDPYKVLRIALESAVSIAGTLLTTEYTIINDPTSRLEFER